MNNKMYYKRLNQKKLYIEVRNLFKANKNKEFIKASKEYLSLFPYDTYVIFMRAKVYRKLEMFDEAISDLKKCLNNDKKNYALTELFFLYYYLNMYNEALELLPILQKKKSIKLYSLYLAELIIKQQLGVDVSNIKSSDYCESQVINYSEDKAFQHIKKHSGDKVEGKSIFNDNIDLNYLFKIIKDNINYANKVNKDELLDVYYFGIFNVGTYNDDFCNFVKVVVIPNTNNIISIYPIQTVEGNPIINIQIDYNKLFKAEEKVKKISRIDKFNQRYNIK